MAKNFKKLLDLPKTIPKNTFIPRRIISLAYHLSMSPKKENIISVSYAKYMLVFHHELCYTSKKEIILKSGSIYFAKNRNRFLSVFIASVRSVKMADKKKKHESKESMEAD